MIIDMRHHLFSLVSVFLALGLGILIGTSITSDGRVVKEQSVLIDSIETQLAQLRRERQTMQVNLKQLEKTLADYRHLTDETFPHAINGRLQEHRVGVVVAGEATDTQALRELLRLAGAQLNGSVLISAEALSSSKMRAELGPALSAVFFGKAVQPEKTVLQWQQLPGSETDSIIVVNRSGETHTNQLAAALSHDAPSTRVVVINDIETPFQQWALVKRLAGEER